MARRACTTAEMERLWDAFEAVDRAAGPIAHGDWYVSRPKVIALRRALDEYRRARDEIDAAREAEEGSP